jgi:hypothetical protein
VARYQQRGETRIGTGFPYRASTRIVRRRYVSPKCVYSVFILTFVHVDIRRDYLFSAPREIAPIQVSADHNRVQLAAFARIRERISSSNFFSFLITEMHDIL